MPRHTDVTLERLHAYVPRQDRSPYATGSVHPRNEWVIDSYRVRNWYYRDAPAVGDRVRFLRDGDCTRITYVNFFHITFANSVSMRRPFAGRRLLACLLPRLQVMKLPVRVRSRVTSLRQDRSTVWV